MFSRRKVTLLVPEIDNSLQVFSSEKYMNFTCFKYLLRKYTDQVLTICEECWHVIVVIWCRMALVMLS